MCKIVCLNKYLIQKSFCMSNTTTKQSVLLKTFRKNWLLQFDQDHASADGGAVLLKACDEIKLHSRPACRISGNQVKCTLQELFQQRMFGIGLCGCYDAARLAHDVFKLLIGRDAVDGHDLASHPTSSRFENTVSSRFVT